MAVSVIFMVLTNIPSLFEKISFLLVVIFTVLANTHSLCEKNLFPFIFSLSVSSFVYQ